MDEAVPHTNPATPENLFERLSALGIVTETINHPPCFSVQDGEKHTGHLPGVHVKNLFLCDAKKEMWLITAPWDRAIDLKCLPEQIGSKRLSFGSVDRLMRTLGVTPGSVTPFAVINDQIQAVRLVLDAWMMQQGRINCHPLVNTMTTSIGPQDLIAFISDCNHRPQCVDLR